MGHEGTGAAAPDGAVADELAIRNLIVRVAQYADGLGSIDEYVALFTEDAEWAMPGNPKRGHDEIRAGAEGRRASGEVGPGSGTRHVVSGIAVELAGDEAVADSYWAFYVDTASAPTMTLMGAYRDVLRRTPDGWRLARREITFG